MARSRVLSGIQPTGSAHLGNLLGAFNSWVRDQEVNDSIFLIVDLHSLTVGIDPKQLKENTLAMAAMLFAVGIDPQKATVVVQSQVPQHCQLCWIMECTATFGELSRMTQFKDKSKGSEMVRAGLFTYPALMAADILLYQAETVPVGADQTQHLELARDLAIRFNRTYGDTFAIPKGEQPKVAARVMDLADPLTKMSKSSSKPSGIIYLSDSDDAIRRKVMRAKTDTYSAVEYKPQDLERAGVTNLLEILSALTGREPSDLGGQFASYGELKEAVAEQLVKAIAPIRERYEELRHDRPHLEEMLEVGRERAEKIAAKTIEAVYQRVGLLGWR